MKKILIINIAIFFLLFASIECFSWYKLYNKYKDEIKAHNNIMGKKPIIPMKYEKVVIPDEKFLLSGLRPVEHRDEKKRPIILFGCSYVYGFGLEDNETFSKKLADYTNRTVLNRGRCGTGLPFLYFQLSNKKIADSFPKNPEYIIYTIIPDHIPRLFRYRPFVLGGFHTLRYKIKNDKLVIDKPMFKIIHSLFSCIVLEEYLAQKNYQENIGENPLFNKLLDESQNLIKEKFPNSKFVVLYYKGPYDKNCHEDKLIYDYIERNKDIIFIDITKEIPNIQDDKEMWLIDNDHPSPKAWDKIIELLDDKLNINTLHHRD